tara:strand:- start:2241 stop:2666 length:426 start_codon:yes stop_codon:yes gene_type:complete
MKIEEHEKALQEHINNLNKAIEEGVEENQRNIGYNVSQGSVELFANYMHHLKLVEGSGDQWDHRTFKNKKKIEQKVPLEFLEQDKIMELMESIERERNVICYGKRKPKLRIEKMITHFQELRKLINTNIGEIKKQNEPQKK